MMIVGPSSSLLSIFLCKSFHISFIASATIDNPQNVCIAMKNQNVPGMLITSAPPNLPPATPKEISNLISRKKPAAINKKAIMLKNDLTGFKIFIFEIEVTVCSLAQSESDSALVYTHTAN